MDDLKSAAGPGGSSRVAYVFFDGCSSTAGWVGAGPILIYVHPTGRLRVPQLMSPKVGITIRMAHAQYGMLDQVDALQEAGLVPDLDPTLEILPRNLRPGPSTFSDSIICLL